MSDCQHCGHTPSDHVYGTEECQKCSCAEFMADAEAPPVGPWRPVCDLTAARLVSVAPRLWAPAVALANASAGPSVAEWAAAYVEAVACLCASVGANDYLIGLSVDRAAGLVGIALTDVAREHLAACIAEARTQPGLAAEYGVR